MSCLLRRLILLFSTLAVLAASPAAWADHALDLGRPLVVVSDDNYPPYVFRGDDGGIQGYLPELWALWSRRTGIAVDFQAMDWAEAQKRMAEGRADVIDTLFRTKEREKTMVFSNPYATLDVALFFHRDLSGIVGAESLRGFTVGVKDGDACVEWLAAKGVESMLPLPSYSAIIDALAERKVLVACIDKPPALYLTYKKGVQSLLRHTGNLYSGQFHWALRKEDSHLLDHVQAGFDLIGEAERRELEDKWLGFALKDYSEALREALKYLALASAVGAALLVWNWLLRRRVAEKTAGLVRALDDLALSEERFRAIFDNVNDAIFIHAVEDGRVVMVNARMREMYGAGDVPVEEITLDRFGDGRPPFDSRTAMLRMQAALQGEAQIFEWRARKGVGSLFWVEVGMRRARLGGTDRLLVVVRDISERKAAQARMEFLAHHDALTGLPNRLLLQDRAAQALARADRDKTRLAVMFVDLDQFKSVNDSMGHQQGDVLLMAAAQRLVGCVREGDTVSRLGGDEFVILLNEVRDADAVVEKALMMQDAVSRPLMLEGGEVSVGFSMGIAMHPEDGDDFDTLMKCADSAMYEVKRSGRNGHRFFAGEMNADAAAHLAVRSGLHRALERGEFRVFYQPQVDLVDGRPCGAEALIRWDHPERGLVCPADFIPVAEDSGLIVPMGEWVLREACRQAVLWAADGRELPVAVNLSAVQFRRGDLEKTVLSALEESGLPPHLLELELTESMLMQDVGAVEALTRRFADMGVRMSIDDFGTGYSSLAYLKRFRVHKLKIDQSFVRDLCKDAEGEAIVRAVISMARSLNLETIAEGVETADVAGRLVLLACSQAQGWLYGKPMEAHAFDKWLASTSRA